MTEMTKVGVFHAFSGDVEHGYVRVGGFHVDPRTGVAELEVTDERAREQLEDLAGGVASRWHKQGAKPADGSLFLRVLWEAFANTSQWRVSDESIEMDTCTTSRTSKR
jgi:hypothetical protein